jgi:hypothetical protein
VSSAQLYLRYANPDEHARAECEPTAAEKLEQYEQIIERHQLQALFRGGRP